MVTHLRATPTHEVTLMETSPARHGVGRYDEVVHNHSCPNHRDGVPPSLVIAMHPSRGRQTAELRIVEMCQTCSGYAVYSRDRIPLRKWFRSWRKATIAAVVTWEHRHSVWGDAAPPA